MNMYICSRLTSRIRVCLDGSIERLSAEHGSSHLPFLFALRFVRLQGNGGYDKETC
jgi:hypothetical protein